MSPYQAPKTLKASIAKCKSRSAAWRGKVIDYAKTLLPGLSRGDRKRLKALLGLKAYRGNIRASDMAAMLKFGRICVDVVHSYWLATFKQHRWFHITLLADEFAIPEHRPVLAIRRLKGKAYKEIQELRLHALAWIDVDPIPRHPKLGNKGAFAFHVHVLAFTDRGDFDLEQARARLEASRSWTCSLGADPTRIIEITNDMGVPAWWAGYGAKPPHEAKNAVRQTDGSFKLLSTRKGYRPQLAFRLFEGLAQLALLETLFSVGDGKELREDIARLMRDWQRKRWPDQRRMAPFNVRSLFRRAWGNTRVKGYERWRIIGFLP